MKSGVGASLTLPYTVSSGESQYPAYNVFAGADLRIFGAGSTASSFPLAATMPFAATVGGSYIRYAIAHDPDFNYSTFDPLNPGRYQAAVSNMSTLLDMNLTDLSPFAKRGGKLLMLHGTADATIPTALSEQYYQRVLDTMGANAVSSFFKYYEVPGYAHGTGAFVPSWDSVSALEQWVENGIPSKPRLSQMRPRQPLPAQDHFVNIRPGLGILARGIRMQQRAMLV